MNIIVMNSGNSKTTDPHRLLLNLLNEINLKRKDKYVALSNLLYMKKYKKVIQNNKFKISAPTWNEEFELRNGSYTVPEIQYFFGYIIKNMRHLLIILQEEYTSVKQKIKSCLK